MGKRNILFFLFVFCVGSILADGGKLFLSWKDFLAGNVETVPELQMEKRRGTKMIIHGGGDYRFFAENKWVNHRVKNYPLFVMMNDSLFLNCGKIKYQGVPFGPWYAECMIVDSLIYFSAISLDKSDRSMGGVLGSAHQNRTRVFYRLNPTNGDMKILRKEEVSALLEKRPDLKKAYEIEAEPEKVDVIRRYLYEIRDASLPPSK